MKHTLTLSLAAGLVSLLFTGCTSVTTSDGAEVIPQPKTENQGYRAVFSHKDVRVRGTADVKVLFGIFSWGVEGYADNSNLGCIGPSSIAKKAAVYNACKANKADILLGTRYVVTSTDYFVYRKVKCEVFGFPANMIGVKKLEPYVLKGGESLVYLDGEPKR